jgi:hypothetical protein
MKPETLQILNLVISGIALPLLGWMLRELYALSKGMSASAERNRGQDLEIVELRARVLGCETRLMSLQVEVARQQGTRGPV